MIRRLLVIVGIVLPLIIALFYFAGQDKTANSSTNKNLAVVSNATVKYGNKGYVPAIVNIKSGGKITFINQTSNSAEPSSDPHPTHSANPELNVGLLNPGQRRTITVERKGYWGMHDHFDFNFQMKVIVQ